MPNREIVSITALKRPADFSHDAGGAQVLSGYLKENHINYTGQIVGPAKKVFQKKN